MSDEVAGRCDQMDCDQALLLSISSEGRLVLCKSSRCLAVNMCELLLSNAWRMLCLHKPPA